MNTQFSGYEYIRYLYSALLQTTNIFDICIWSFCRQRIYLIFVFGPQSEYEYIRYSYSVKSLYTLVHRQQNSHIPGKVKTNTKLEFNLWGRGVIKSWHFIYSICIYVWEEEDSHFARIFGKKSSVSYIFRIL